EKGLQLKASDIAQAELVRGAIAHRAAEFFQRYDLLVCPTAAVPPFDVDKRYVTEINGIELDNYVTWLLITFAITLTACPSISVPCGFTKYGLPVGLQIIGPRANEYSVLSAAAMFEQEAGLALQLPVDPRPQPTD
ncbi:MAG TPA: amidase, partial [Dehalococcoidia bacterium]|nr:amidase [Dehalococcoidia bacterium]